MTLYFTRKGVHPSVIENVLVAHADDLCGKGFDVLKAALRDTEGAKLARLGEEMECGA